MRQRAGGLGMWFVMAVLTGWVVLTAILYAIHLPRPLAGLIGTGVTLAVLGVAAVVYVRRSRP